MRTLALTVALGLSLSAQEAPQNQGDFFAIPQIFAMSFEEAVRPPKLRLHEDSRLHLEWHPTRRNRAADLLLAFGAGLLTGQSFQRWEQDPQVIRRLEHAYLLQP